MALMTVYDVAGLFGVVPQTLYSKPWRAKVGLPCVKIGASIRFRREDVERVIERGREVLPPMPSMLTEVNGHVAD